MSFHKTSFAPRFHCESGDFSFQKGYNCQKGLIMMILKLPLLEKYVYINAEKILFFEENKMGYTELHLDSGETLILPITPEELCLFMNEPIDDPKQLTSSDLSAIFSR